MSVDTQRRGMASATANAPTRLPSADSNGTTTSSTPCGNGCATCPVGEPDVCKTSASQTNEQACAECDYYDDDVCDGTRVDRCQRVFLPVISFSPR